MRIFVTHCRICPQIFVAFQLPPTASYQMLRDKCLEFGDVQRVEEKGTGTVLVAFGTEWEAERAISILLVFRL